MKILIITNTDKDKHYTYTNKILNVFKNDNVDIFLQKDMANHVSNIDHLIFFENIDSIIECVDLIICVGGDGTIIHTSKYISNYNKPLLGINAGRLGFLANLDYDNLYKLKKLLDNNYELDKRMTLSLVHKSPDFERSYIAVNDIVISRGSFSRIIDLDILCTGKSIGNFRADGVIFSTPTGSTAYSLSAGGPIVDPSINCIIMTPICPHSLVSRTLMFSENKILQVKPSFYKNNEIYLAVDGEDSIKVGDKDEIFICKGEKDIDFIKISDESFFDVINSKFIERSIR